MIRMLELLEEQARVAGLLQYESAWRRRWIFGRTRRRTTSCGQLELDAKTLYSTLQYCSLHRLVCRLEMEIGEHSGLPSIYNSIVHSIIKTPLVWFY